MLTVVTYQRTSIELDGDNVQTTTMDGWWPPSRLRDSREIHYVVVVVVVSTAHPSLYSLSPGLAILLAAAFKRLPS